MTTSATYNEHGDLVCPGCGAACERDYVDNGVGMEPCGPWGCPECHWVEKRAVLAFNEEDSL